MSQDDSRCHRMSQDATRLTHLSLLSYVGALKSNNAFTSPRYGSKPAIAPRCLSNFTGLTGHVGGDEFRVISPKPYHVDKTKGRQEVSRRVRALWAEGTGRDGGMSPKSLAMSQAEKLKYTRCAHPSKASVLCQQATGKITRKKGR
eukprot:1321241-Amorphochlora_amoeboformis.AAC.1